MAARDRSWPTPAHVLAVYPIAGGGTDTASYRANAAAKPLNKPMMEWFFRHALRTDADRKHHRIDLVTADLKGLPPNGVAHEFFGMAAVVAKAKDAQQFGATALK